MDSSSVISNYSEFSKIIKEGASWTPPGIKQAEYTMDEQKDVIYELYKVRRLFFLFFSSLRFFNF